MKNPVNFVGIDVSSTELVIEIQSSDTGEITTGTFSNSRDGHKKLIKHLTKSGKTAKVCMEATGIYHIDVAVALERSGKIEVMVVNPRAMKHFGIAMMQRSKTDKIDAHIILEYLLRMNFSRWKLPSEKALSIHALSRRLEQVKEEINRESNRLSAAESSTSLGKEIEKSINKVIDFLKKHCLVLQKKIMALIDADASLKKQYERLISIKGVGELSAIQILSEMLFVSDDIDPDQLTAYAGLDPRATESGSSINKPKRISRNGNKHLRRALYMPALVAIQHDENVKSYYDKLVKKGKKKKQAIVAVMRKLLRSICGMLQSDSQWDGGKFYKIC